MNREEIYKEKFLECIKEYNMDNTNENYRIFKIGFLIGQSYELNFIGEEVIDIVKTNINKYKNE